METLVQIRKITLDDTKDVERISKAITTDVADIDFEKIIDEKIRNDGGETCLVAETKDGQVVGYMVSNVLDAGFGLKKSAWIVTLGVDPEFMGKGIGKTLAREMFEVHKKQGIDQVYSSVLWDSIDLLSFFKTLGFERSSFINLRKEI